MKLTHTAIKPAAGNELSVDHSTLPLRLCVYAKEEKKAVRMPMLQIRRSAVEQQPIGMARGVK
jgi:hypothetical protein